MRDALPPPLYCCEDGLQALDEQSRCWGTQQHCIQKGKPQLIVDQDLVLPSVTEEQILPSQQQRYEDVERFLKSPTAMVKGGNDIPFTTDL